MRLFLVTLTIAFAITGSANAATLKISTTGIDTGICQDAPCKTAGYAYKRASIIPEASEILFAEGSYPAQKIVNTLSIPRASDAKITFKPEDGASVKLAYFEIDGPDHVDVTNFKMDGWQVGQATDVDMIDDDVDNGKPIINSSTDVRVIRPDIGPQCAGHGPGATGGGGAMQIKALAGKGQPKDIEIIDGRFHDFTRCAAPDEDVHLDCLHLFTVDGLTIRNMTFDKCSVYDILFAKDISGSGYGPPTNVLIENNRFMPMIPGSSGSIGIFGDNQKFTNIAVRNNSFTGNSVMAKSSSTVPVYTNVRFENNVLRSFNRTNCNQVGVTYTGNFYERVTGGSTSATCVEHVDDLRLLDDGRVLPGSAAIDSVHGAGSAPAPATDILGTSRPQFQASDAGAFELPAPLVLAPITISDLLAIYAWSAVPFTFVAIQP